MTLVDAHRAVTEAVRDGRVTRQQEAEAIQSATLSNGTIDWPQVQRLLGLPNPTTFWNKFGG